MLKIYAGSVRAALWATWVNFALLILVFALGRFLMFQAFVAPDVLLGHEDDLSKMWLMGLRYDGRMAGILSLPGLALALTIGWFGLGRRIVTLLLPLYYPIVLIIAVLFTAGNFFWYQTYHNYIDIFVFGFFDEEPLVVLQAVWNDYPVIIMSIVLIVCFFLLRFINRLIVRRFCVVNGSSMAVLLALIISIPLLILASRGSLDTFPLRRVSSQVSTVDVINKLTPNGLSAFTWAYSDLQNDGKLRMVTLEEGNRLMAQAGLTDIFKTVPENEALAEIKPNVMIVMMEGFGSNLLSFDQEGKNDLLGDLRPYFRDGYLFKRAVSEGNGTAPSFAAMFFLSPIQNISHSSWQKIKISNTPIGQYNNAGYKTAFIYPGNALWRNMGNYMQELGIDEVYDENDLMKVFPESQKDRSTYGVPDEYCYMMAEKLMAESDEPVFIIIMTTTNHPPYRVPSTYTPNLISVTDQLSKTFESGTEYETVLGTFQYAADAMGKSLNRISSSSYGDKTIVAITGDHQMRRLNLPQPSGAVLDKAVPIFFHIPDKIKAATSLKYDKNRVGSHKDLLPTVYSYSLPGAKYLALGGRNMLDEIDDPERSFGYSETLWIDDIGVTTAGGAGYEWAESEGVLVNPEIKENPATLNRLNAFASLLRWQLYARLNGLF